MDIWIQVINSLFRPLVSAVDNVAGQIDAPTIVIVTAIVAVLTYFMWTALPPEGGAGYKGEANASGAVFMVAFAGGVVLLTHLLYSESLAMLIGIGFLIFLIDTLATRQQSQ